MLGQSIYVSKFDESFVPNEEVDLYFTSMHIAEEFNDEYKEKAMKLLTILHQYHKKIIVDISSRGVEALGFGSINEFLDHVHIDVLRLDFGFAEEEILKISDRIAIGINASTNDYHLAELIKERGNQVVAIHNFYPRPETGLDVDFFIQRNQWLMNHGIEVMAFIPGDEELRGPLYEGLPTLESQRNMLPYIAYVQMKLLYGIDNVIIGDLGINNQQLKLISQFEKDDRLYIPCDIDKKYHEYLNVNLTIRDDSPNNLLRVMESRMYASFKKQVEPDHTIERTRGTITIDNVRYLRYSGEMQICKCDFPNDEKVNVIGHVDSNYLPLLDLVSRGAKIKLVSLSKN